MSSSSDRKLLDWGCLISSSEDYVYRALQLKCYSNRNNFYPTALNKQCMYYCTHKYSLNVGTPRMKKNSMWCGFHGDQTPVDEAIEI